MQQLSNLLETPAEFGSKLHQRDEQAGDHGHVDLDEHGVFGSAHETLDLEVLLDESEEGLNLPAVPIDVRDGLSRQVETVCQELIMRTCLRVSVADSSQFERSLRGVDQDILVRSQAVAFDDLSSGDHRIDHVLLLPGDEENLVLCQRLEPVEVDVSSVKHNDGPFGKLKGSGYLGFMALGIRNQGKGGDVAVVVEQKVELDPSSFFSEHGPGVGLEIEFDGAGVQAEEPGAKAEFMSRCSRGSSQVKLAEKRLEEFGGPGVVGIREGGPCDLADAQMVEPGNVGAQVAHPVAQTLPGGEMDEDKACKLTPITEFPWRSPYHVFAGQGVEFMPGNQV